jgi:[protein-PII] uridylyltransferase
VPTRVEFHDDDAAGRSIVELITTDNPGLLSQVGQVFYAQGVHLQNAKVATFGSQAEDVFHVTNRDNRPLTETEQNSLREQLIVTLGTHY